jgi:hypothetical protein
LAHAIHRRPDARGFPRHRFPFAAAAVAAASLAHLRRDQHPGQLLNGAAGEAKALQRQQLQRARVLLLLEPLVHRLGDAVGVLELVLRRGLVRRVHVIAPVLAEQLVLDL